MPNQGIIQPTLPQAPIKPFTSAPSTSTLTPQSVVSPIQPQAPQPAPQAPQTTPQNGALDPKLVNLAQAIRQTESQGNFSAKGASGEYGAYQFMPDTWNGNASRFGVNVPLDQATPAQQNEVAYKQLQEWSAQHPDWDVGNFASAWNAGPGKPNAYKEGNVGTNSKGVSYDTPGYAKKVAEAYQQFKAQNAQNAPVANVPQQGDGSSFLGDLSSGNVLGAAQKAGDFAFPIVSDLAKDFEGSSTKSGLQQLGDAGLSALWFLPFGGIAEGATDVARVGLGLAESSKAAKVIGGVATGLGAGYAGDVSSNLSQGKTGLDVAKPGLGTALGGVLPGALAGAGSLYQKFAGDDALLTKVQQAYEDAAGATKLGIRAASKTASKGLDSNPEFLAHAGILPETEEVNGTRKFMTGENSVSQKEIQGRIEDLTNLRDEAIAKAGTDHPMYIEDMRQAALERADGEFAGTAKQTVESHINAEFDAYKQQFGDKKGNISLTEANEIKKDLQGKTNYDATRPTVITRANSLMANVAKVSVEEGANSAGLKGVKNINQVIQQHIDAKAFLNRIDGQTIKGGKVGKLLYEGIGAAVGNTVGKVIDNATGLPGIAQSASTIVGAGVGNIISRFVQKLSAGGMVSAASIGRMASKEPEAVQNFLEYLGKQGKIIAPVIKPSGKTGIDTVQEVLEKSPGDTILKAFDHDGALKAGYSQEEIDSFLESETGESKNTP